ncbi:hypothetical protein NDU88_004967 [Pleurodeles waltl]|uniref:Uncharacterized protein n=1 Tax=Pleurodeles waltl TaxID=8319 RepID=A0AAV7LLC2_PLEWA|nr:hypothetical protein NDU88_004967 [Pleurodeles waltl]
MGLHDGVRFWGALLRLQTRSLTISSFRDRGFVEHLVAVMGELFCVGPSCSLGECGEGVGGIRAARRVITSQRTSVRHFLSRLQKLSSTRVPWELTRTAYYFKRDIAKEHIRAITKNLWRSPA